MIRGRALALTLAIGLKLTIASVSAEQHKEPADNSPSDVASVWFDTLYGLVKAEATAPPRAARIYGVAAIALYEAVVPGTLSNRSLVGQLNSLVSAPQPKKHGKYHWPTVANAALGRTIRGLFLSLKPESLEAVYALEQSFATQFRPEVEPQDYLRSVAHSQAVADAILAWAASDG